MFSRHEHEKFVQKSLRFYAENERFYWHSQDRFFLPMLLMSKLDTAAEEAWVQGQFTLYRGWYPHRQTILCVRG